MCFRPLVPILACLAMSATAQDKVVLPEEVYQKPGPHVVVNGVLLKAPVREMGGSLFLPMRAVFEALSAEVRWFPAAQQIVATRGSTTVQLWINRPVAIVNDQEIQLSAPPNLMAGTTYVPLRFPAEAFGGEVKWLGAVRTAAITIAPVESAGTPAPGPTTGGATQQAGGPTTLDGVVMTKVTSGVTAILVQNAKGETTLVQMVAGATVTRANMAETPKASTFAAIELGDRVRVTRDASGKATAVEARFAQVKGVAAAIANNRLLLEDGTLYQLQPDIKVLRNDGEAAPLAQVVKGTAVTLDLTPETTNVWRLTIPAGAAQTPVATDSESPSILTVAAVGYTRPLRAGDKLTVQVTGAPNAQRVTASIGDVLRDLRLTETSAGTYTRQVTIGPNTNATAAYIVATMRIDGKDSPSVRSAAPITIDTRPPSFDALIPADGTQIVNRNPTVEAAYADPGGSGIDPGSVSIRINGRDVLRDATVTDTRARYRAQGLPVGPVSIQIRVADLAGNEATAEWTVTVGDAPAVGDRYVRHDAAKPLMAGEKITLNAKVPGTPSKLEWYVGNKLIGSTTSRAAGGEYRTVYTVTPDDAIGEHSVSVRVLGSTGDSQVLFATDPITVVAKPRAFRITSPEDKSKAPGTLVVTGEATPNSEVRVTIEYESRVAFLPVRGQLQQVVVTADAKGAWKTEGIETGGMLLRPDTYTIRAEHLDGDGNVAEKATITLTRR